MKKVARLLQWQQVAVSLDAPMGDEGDTVLAEFVQDEDAPPIEEVFADRQLRESVRDVIAARLLPREQRVLHLRLGFGSGQARTLEQVAGVLGVTRERVRQIETRALRKLRHASARHRELGEAWF